MAVIGLDLSLTNTGLVVLEHGVVQEFALIRTKPTKDKAFDDQCRHDEIARTVFDYVLRWSTGRLHIGLESSAPGAIHSDDRVHELNGVVKLDLWRRLLPFTLYRPNTVKKFATDHGNASKAMMAAAAVADGFPHGSNHNLADAYWVAKLTAFDLGVTS